jgi:hypothetical protein
MTILDKRRLKQCSPFIKFCVLDTPLNIGMYEWPSSEHYQTGIIFEFADDLLDEYCRLTRSYAPFDPFNFTQLQGPQEIYRLLSRLLMWQFQIAEMPFQHFSNGLSLCNTQDITSTMYTTENMKNDLLETLHFLIGKLQSAALYHKCVAIVGI